MSRYASLLLLVGFMSACASTSTPGLVLSDQAPSLSSNHAQPLRVEPSYVPSLASEAAVIAAQPTVPSAVPYAAAPARRASLRDDRFTVKGGYYSAEDADELDDGFIVNVSWMKFVVDIFAFEFEIGYFDTDGEDGGIEAEAWGIPIMVNGRLNVPLWILDIYGGIGIGTIYYDAEAFDGINSIDEDGFVLAGNGFFGASINALDKVSVGLEAKYYISEEDEDLGDTAFDAFAVLLTVGFGY